VIAAAQDRLMEIRVEAGTAHEAFIGRYGNDSSD
jgi:hypothetical protein